MRLSIVGLVSVLALGSSSLFADPIPYPNPGTAITGSTTVTASGGDITAYFVSYNAGDTDQLFLVNLNNPTVLLGPAFTNNSSPQGSTYDFGSFAAGTSLAFAIVNDSTGMTYSSDTALSDDGSNHAYVYDFGGGTLSNGQGGGDVYVFPAGTYVGFEDLPIPGGDEDYNDLTFIFTNVSAIPTSATPEPGTFLLLGTGLLGAAGAMRRRFAR